MQQKGALSVFLRDPKWRIRLCSASISGLELLRNGGFKVQFPESLGILDSVARSAPKRLVSDLHVPFIFFQST